MLIINKIKFILNYHYNFTDQENYHPLSLIIIPSMKLASDS